LRPKVISKARVDLAALFICLTVLVAGCFLSAYSAWRWPLIGDSSLIRYVIFLIHAGKAPYSQIIDINLPGSYLLEYLAMKSFGMGAHGFRMYDGLLCLLLCVFSYLLGNKDRRDSLFCLAGALLFVLIHLQDGLNEAGQRDLAIAVVVFGGLVTLIRQERLTLFSVFLFEALIGFSLTVKPTLLALALLPFLLWKTFPDRSYRGVLRLIGVGLTGMAIPIVLMFWWLWSYHSVHAFITSIRSLDLLHGELGRKSFWFLMNHCTSPVIVLFVLWLAIIATGRLTLSNARKLLFFAALCGLLSYLEQGKGFSYQRYPFLAVGVVLVFLDFSKASKITGAPRILTLVGLCCVSFWFAPRFTLATRSFDTVVPFQESLEQTLRVRPGAVQCLDTYGGCINALYDIRLEQATGYLYDCYLFTPANETRDRYRRDFLRAFDAARPATVVLTDQPCFDSVKTFDRLNAWPEFNRQLNRDYVVGSEWRSSRTYRWWSRAEAPTSYRIYTLK
jgi:hypothetical protein